MKLLENLDEGDITRIDQCLLKYPSALKPNLKAIVSDLKKELSAKPKPDWKKTLIFSFGYSEKNLDYYDLESLANSGDWDNFKKKYDSQKDFSEKEQLSVSGKILCGLQKSISSVVDTINNFTVWNGFREFQYKRDNLYEVIQLMENCLNIIEFSTKMGFAYPSNVVLNPFLENSIKTQVLLGEINQSFDSVLKLAAEKDLHQERIKLLAGKWVLQKGFIQKQIREMEIPKAVVKNT